MTLIKELQINIAMSNYTQRSSSYSANYDYLYLDNLMDSSYATLFRNDLKNLKINSIDGNSCQLLYLPSYGSQAAAILARIPASKISQTTKLILEVHDTTFSSTLTPVYLPFMLGWWESCLLVICFFHFLGRSIIISFDI